MSKRITYGLLGVVVIALIAVAFAGGFIYGHTAGKSKALVIGTPKSVLLMEEARNVIRDGFVRPVSDKELNDGALSGMVKSLGDKYSEYISPKEMIAFRAHTMGEFSGVGVTLGMRRGKLIVVRPLPGTPAKRAGIRAGDAIVTIDGQSTAKMPLATASEKIRGPKGTKVALGIKRGGKMLTFKLIRATISMPSVRARIVGPGLAYINIMSFTPKTGDDLESEIRNLDTKKHVKGVVIDLRENPGGLVETAVEAASVFIPQGPIVSLKGRDGEPRVMSAVEDEYHTKMKLVVLVNNNSASASEIFAGAIQDDKRGLVVGTKTFGKASVQTIEDLSNKGAIKITSAHYYTPKNRLIDHVGIKPDIIDKGPADPLTLGTSKDLQRNRAIEILRDLVAGRLEP